MAVVALPAIVDARARCCPARRLPSPRRRSRPPRPPTASLAWRHTARKRDRSRAAWRCRWSSMPRRQEPARWAGESRQSGRGISGRGQVGRVFCAGPRAAGGGGCRRPPALPVSMPTPVRPRWQHAPRRRPGRRGSRASPACTIAISASTTGMPARSHPARAPDRSTCSMARSVVRAGVAADGRQIHAQLRCPRASISCRLQPDAGHERVAERRPGACSSTPRIGADPARAASKAAKAAWASRAGDRLHQRARSAPRRPRADHGMHVVRRRSRPAVDPSRSLEQRLAVSHAAGGPAGDQGRARPDRRRPPRPPRSARGRRAIAGDIDGLTKSNRWQRERIVIGSLSGSVVQSTNFTCGGGSSSVFSKALKASPREHVHFVDDVHLVAAAGRPHGDVLPQLADLVDAAVAGGVDLHHVHVLPGGDRLARASQALQGSAAGPLAAFERLGVDPRQALVLPTPRAPVKR